jgi:cytochrome bd ubiquinol oxidase subunit II
MIDFNEVLDLRVLWYFLIGILLTGYVILDGFDLGVGSLHLFTKSDEHRRIMINSIGPVWDGNEVWLVTGGGALFAAFPAVYATAFSGFYLPFMLLLSALIFRAVAIEFRSKQSSKLWRTFFDFSFSFSSLLSAFLIGVVVGNLVWGLNLDQNNNIEGIFFEFLNPYTILMGITTVALFMMHGAIYVVLKTENDLQNQARRWTHYSIVFFIICFSLVTISTLLYTPHMADRIKENPYWLILPLLTIFSIANIPREIFHKKEERAFISSCFAILSLMSLFALGVFPDFIVDRLNPEQCLNLYNSSSSLKTLNLMTWIAIIGVPLVLSYTVSIYWIFRGKVKIDKDSY